MIEQQVPTQEPPEPTATAAPRIDPPPVRPATQQAVRPMRRPPVVPWSVMAPMPIGPMQPNVFQRHWPIASRECGPQALFAAGAAGLAAAAMLPPDRAGVGWLAVGLVVFVGLANVGRVTRTPQMAGMLWGTAALALLSVGTFRAAGWLFALCVLTAIAVVVVGIGGGRTPIGMLLSTLIVPAATILAIPWVARGVGRVRAVSGGARMLRLAASIALSLVLLLVFGALFASADPAFERIGDAIVPDISGLTVFRWVFMFVVFTAGTAGAAFLVTNPTTFGALEAGAPKPVRRLEWALPVGAVVAMFAVFVGVQITVLFGDRTYVMETVGLTFAEYARRGFGQLLVITLLTLLVMAIAVRKAPRANAGDRMLLRVLVGALAVGALVVVASALWRMDVYEEAYGFTRLRVFVSAFELWLGVLFLLVLGAGIKLRAGWLPRAALASWVLILLGLAVLNPDHFIAERNIARADQDTSIDASYLATLSADAVPALQKLPPRERLCALTAIADDLRDAPDEWRQYNISRGQARAALEDLPPTSDCDYF